MKLILIKKLSYQKFLIKKKEIKFKHIHTKLRLVLPTLLSYNREVLVNDGLPLEFILNGFNSNKIFSNSDITFIDLSSDLFDCTETFTQLNQIINKNKNEDIIIVSLSGEQDNGVSGGISTKDDVEVPVIFTGPTFKNKTIVNDIIYTLNDLAITINNFYHTKVENARGHIIKFLNKGEKKSTEKVVDDQSLVKYIKHIIIFGSDAFGSYLIKSNELSNIKRMMNNGVYSLQSHAVIPTVSANNWNSIIRGLSPNLHGFTQWNSFPPEIDPVLNNSNEKLPPSLFYLVKEKNPAAKTCAFFRWPQWQHIIELDKVDYYYNLIQKKDVEDWGQTAKSTFTDLNNNIAINDKIVNEAIKYISKEKPFLSLIYVNEPDTTGHNIGHQTIEINDAAKRVDSWLGLVVKMIETDAEMKDNTLLVFVGDHGGLGVGSECHGGISPWELEVPLILYGSMVNKLEIKKPVMQYDFVKTLALKLKLNVPQQWNGKIIHQIFKKSFPAGLALYQREIGTYALYEDGEFIFLMLGYNEAIKRTKTYGQENQYSTFKYYDINYNLVINKI